MKQETVSIVISITALLMICIAHVVFIVKIKGGQIKPNASSWGIWVFTSLVNVFSYNAMSKDIIVAFWTFMTFTMCAIVFVYALWKRSFSRVTMPEWLLLASGIMATLILYFYHDAKRASLILAAASIIPFLPMIAGLKNNPGNEDPLPWIILVIGYALVIANVIIRWKGEWGNLAMPTLYVIGNSCVIWLSSNTRKRRIKMSKQKSPAHLVILEELLYYQLESEGLFKKMEVARKQFGDDSPYHTQNVMATTKCLLLLRILHRIEIPLEDKSQVIEKLELLKEIPIPGYKQQIEEILDELSQ